MSSIEKSQKIIFVGANELKCLGHKKALQILMQKYQECPTQIAALFFWICKKQNCNVFHIEKALLSNKKQNCMGFNGKFEN